MLGWSEQRFEEVSDGGSGHRDEPGSAAAHLARSEVSEPGSCAEIGSEVRGIQMQCERGPRAPPFARLHPRGIELPEIEGIEPHEPVGERPGDADEHQDIRRAADPGIAVHPWWGRQWRGRPILGVVLQQVPRSVARIVRRHLQQKLAVDGADERLDADRGEHQQPLVALAPVHGAVHSDQIVLEHGLRLRTRTLSERVPPQV